MTKNKTSGNQAASKHTQPSRDIAPPVHNPPPGKGRSQLTLGYVDSPPEPIEPLVTKQTLCNHYRMALRTLDYALTLGLPKIQIGRHVRFRFSEVQPWFEKNGYRRFASEGRKAAIEKALLKSKQFRFALSGGVRIEDEKPKRSKSCDSNKTLHDHES